MINWSKTMVAAVATILSLLTTFTFVSAASTYTLSGSSTYYDIQSIEFKDSENNLVSGITENGTISKIALTKMSDELMPATIILAIYEPSGRLRTMGMVDIDGDKLEGEYIDVPITVNLGTNTIGLSIKVTIWNSISGLMPLADIYQHIDERGLKCNISTINGQPAYLTMSASGIDTFTGKIFTITYDPSILQLTDAVGLTPQNDSTIGIAPFTNIEILSIENGRIIFLVNTTIPNGKTWSGDINIVKFIGLQTATSTVVVAAH